MTRANAADYLANSLSQWWTEIGVTPTDDPAALAEVIDDALLAIGTSYDLLATTDVTTDIAGFRNVLRYMGLLRIQAAITMRVDLQLDGPQMSKNRSQAVRQIEKAVDDARKDAVMFMTTTGEWGTGSISLDYLEPVVNYG